MATNYLNWLNRSSDLLKWSEDNFKLENYPLVCYLTQQSIELLLKGLIYKQDKIPPKSHNLVRLAKLAKIDTNKLIEELTILSEYYFESRYPDSFREELNNKAIAQKALNYANKIRQILILSK